MRNRKRTCNCLVWFDLRLLGDCGKFLVNFCCGGISADLPGYTGILAMSLQECTDFCTIARDLENNAQNLVNMMPQISLRPVVNFF